MFLAFLVDLCLSLCFRHIRPRTGHPRRNPRLISVNDHRRKKGVGAIGAKARRSEPANQRRPKQTLLTPVEPVQDTACSQQPGPLALSVSKPAVPAPLASPNIGTKNLRDPAAKGWQGPLASMRCDFDAALVHDAGRRDQLREASSARWRRVHPRL
jgi:hypothetical protein